MGGQKREWDTQVYKHGGWTAYVQLLQLMLDSLLNAGMAMVKHP